MNTMILQKGQIFNSLQCGQFEIIEEIMDKFVEEKKWNTQKFKIKFLKTGTIKEVFWNDIRKGTIQDYNLKKILGSNTGYAINCANGIENSKEESLKEYGRYNGCRLDRLMSSAYLAGAHVLAPTL